MFFRFCYIVTIFISSFGLLGYCWADTNSFYPTWKHLDNHGKQLYISGYLHGLRDAEEVVVIAKEYVEKNPSLAIQTLDKVQRLCSSTDMNSGSLVPEVDSYYANIENQQAPLSLAISSGGQKIRGVR